MFTKDDVPSTQTMAMNAVGENPRMVFERRRQLVDLQLGSFILPSFSANEARLDYTLGYEMDKDLLPFVSLNYLGYSVIAATLPMRGDKFINLKEHIAKHQTNEEVQDLGTRSKQVLNQRVDEISGRNMLVVDRVKAIVTGIWMMAKISKEEKDIKKFKLEKGMRTLAPVEVLSWVMAYNNHPLFSEPTAGNGEERMVAKVGIALPGEKVSMTVSVNGKTRTSEFFAYLKRAPRRDLATGSYGWLLCPYFSSFFHLNNFPLVVLTTPILSAERMAMAKVR